ncbi:tRNA-dihydrouridine synthase family protein [Candidatus Peribacteria bacterium]|nr:tRNA-dihydrouridine synthase family protein [Candidatus Peribacteria bacterium]
MNWIDTFISENKPIVALAPMDGYCDSAFRAICQKVSGGKIVVFSEFYSADGLHHNPALAKKVLTHNPIEHPLVFQIFGNTPEIFLSAGKIIESYGAQGVDINMGCPAKKVVKCGYGSGLMLDRDRAMKIVNILAENLSIPVTVKTRLGWN